MLDFDALDEFEQEGRRMMRVLLVAAQKAMVEGLVHGRRPPLVPLGLDLIPFALIRSVGRRRLGDGGGGVEEALIDVGSDVTSICVHQHGQARFVRILPAGGATSPAPSPAPWASPRPTRSASSGAGRRGRGPVAGGGRPGRPHPSPGLRRTLRSSLDFYLSQTPGARIGRVLYTGGGSKLTGFGELLEDRMPGEVAEGRPFRRVRPAVDLDEDMKDEAEPLLAVAIGLALPGEAA